MYVSNATRVITRLAVPVPAHLVVQGLIVDLGNPAVFLATMDHTLALALQHLVRTVPVVHTLIA